MCSKCIKVTYCKVVGSISYYIDFILATSGAALRLATPDKDRPEVTSETAIMAGRTGAADLD